MPAVWGAANKGLAEDRSEPYKHRTEVVHAKEEAVVQLTGYCDSLQVKSLW